ncbi:MAG: deoxyuridine 5'-triphosphate nucleotidohydrolase [bacterium]|nr:deoxyuridine 5'-triphosphate nucleotidohydrolase [bacterium]
MRKFEKISFEQFKKDIKDDKVLYESYNLPKRKTKSSAGYDFFAISDFEIEPGRIKKIPTGIKAKYPFDEVLLLVVRSSMGFKYNVRMCNQVGVIDSDFYNNEENEGHMWFALQNEGDNTFKVKSGESFGQGIFIKYYTCGEEVEDERKSWTGKPKEGESINE